MSVISQALEDEFQRLWHKREGFAMSDVMAEAAGFLGVSTRHLYNYRSGKWSLPADYIKPLCEFFGSPFLADVIAEAGRQVEIEIPTTYDLARMITELIRADMAHYQMALDAFENNGIDRHDLDALQESGRRVIQNVRQLEAIAVADYERRKALVMR